MAGVTEEYVTSHTELLDIMSIGDWYTSSLKLAYWYVCDCCISFVSFRISNAKEPDWLGLGLGPEERRKSFLICNRLICIFLLQGAMNRATAATGINEGSSRSHSVFTVTGKLSNFAFSRFLAHENTFLNLKLSSMLPFMLLYALSNFSLYSFHFFRHILFYWIFIQSMNNVYNNWNQWIKRILEAVL